MSNQLTDLFSVNFAANAVAEQLQKMPQQVKELDDAVTDLTLTTGANRTQIKALLDTYTDMSDELKSTVTDMTVAATEWLKQGKSMEETETLLRDTMILSRISNLSTADSMEYLTSVMNGYQLTANDTLGVIDRLSAVDLASGADITSLADGISAVSDNAERAGVSMDKLLGYLAAVGETSRMEMSEVEAAYNTMFARMDDIRSSRLTDSRTGDDLSEVETTLARAGIRLRDSQNAFRDFDDVLDETANRWTSFSDAQKNAIADAFAGNSHIDTFAALMENYDSALNYSEASIHSSGQALEQFRIYEDSLAAHTAELENAFIQLSNTFLNSDFLKELTDLGTTGVKAVDDLVGALTPLGTLAAVGGGILGGKNLGKTYGNLFSIPYMPVISSSIWRHMEQM